MGFRAIRLVYSLNFPGNNTFIRCNSIYSLAQLSEYNSDSSSDEESSSSSTYPLFSQQSNISTEEDQFVELDTIRVSEILQKMRTEPTNVHSFFRRLKEGRFKRDVRTYVAIIRILCYLDWDMRLDSILLEVIQSKKSELGFDISDLFQTLVNEASKPGEPHSLARVFDALIKVYISIGNPKEALNSLSKIMSNGYLPDIRTFNLLMNRFIEWKGIDTALAVYKELKPLGLKPNVYTYGIVIKALCRERNFREVMEVFKEMEEANVICSPYIYTVYIEGLCNNGMSDLGYAILQDCRLKSNVAFDVYAYLVVIRGFVRENNLDKAEEILQRIEDVGLLRNQDCYRALIRAYCERGDIKKFDALHNDMLSKGIRTNCFILSSILQCYFKLGMGLQSVNLFNYYMNNKGIFLDKMSFSIVISGLCKLKEVELAMRYLFEMKYRKIVPDAQIYTTLINGYFLLGEHRTALILFEEMFISGLKPDCITYNVLAKHGISANDVKKGVFGCFKEAKQSVRKMIDDCCESNDIGKAFKLFVSYSKQGVVLSKSCYENLIAMFCNAGDVKKANMVFGSMILSNWTPDVITCTTMLHSYLKKSYFHKAHYILMLMKVKRIEADVITYTDLISKTENDAYAVHLWNKMKRDGLKLDLICYTTMIDRYCKSGNIDKAKLLFNEMIRDGLEPDLVTYTCLIFGYSSMGKKYEAEALFHEMASKVIQRKTPALLGFLSTGSRNHFL